MTDWQREAADPAQPLICALRLQGLAARQGFDWDELGPMWDKLAEESAELREAVGAGDAPAVSEELGDLLFMLVNLARQLGVDPESALDAANRKFIRRLRHIQGELARRDRRMEDQPIEVLESLWQGAKRIRPDD